MPKARRRKPDALPHGASLGKRPRQYAVEIMKAKTAEEKKRLFDEVPDNYKPIVREHCYTWRDLARFKRR
jgi:hypothetical protein